MALKMSSRKIVNILYRQYSLPQHIDLHRNVVKTALYLQQANCDKATIAAGLLSKHGNLFKDQSHGIKVLALYGFPLSVTEPIRLLSSAYDYIDDIDPVDRRKYLNLEKNKYFQSALKIGFASYDNGIIDPKGKTILHFSDILEFLL